MVKLLFA